MLQTIPLDLDPADVPLRCCPCGFCNDDAHPPQTAHRCSSYGSASSKSDGGADPTSPGVAADPSTVSPPGEGSAQAGERGEEGRVRPVQSTDELQHVAAHYLEAADTLMNEVQSVTRCEVATPPPEHVVKSVASIMTKVESKADVPDFPGSKVAKVLDVLRCAHVQRNTGAFFDFRIPSASPHARLHVGPQRVR